jgi:hypothetical protein
MAAGLTPSDLDQLRAALDGGRKPKVVFTEAAGQIAGQSGQVIELTDPAGSDEWIVVRFGRDELPFSPSDLSIPGRGAAKAVPARTPNGRRTTQATTQKPEAAKPEPKKEPAFVLDRPPVPREGKTMTVAPTTATPPITSANGNAANGNASNGSASNGNAAKPKPKPAKAPASLVVTLSYADREWTVAATQGTKSLAKPYVIRPAEALRMVALIDVPGVHEAVESIIAAERVEAEGRAERLRVELAEIESRLAELNHNN